MTWTHWRHQMDRFSQLDVFNYWEPCSFFYMYFNLSLFILHLSIETGIQWFYGFYIFFFLDPISSRSVHF